MRPFLYMVGEESPWLQPLWVFRAPPLRASDASPQRLAYSKKCSRFIYLPYAFENLTNFIHRLFRGSFAICGNGRCVQ